MTSETKPAGSMIERVARAICAKTNIAMDGVTEIVFDNPDYVIPSHKRTDGEAIARWELYAERARAAIAALSRSEAPVAWRCFFCDEVFTDAKAASDHFGDTICADPLCKVAQIDGGIAQTIAKLAEQLNQFQIEDNASFREFYALGADHRAALIREEQKGYDRGLKDGQALATLPQPGAVEPTIKHQAEALLSEVEQRFPDWRSFRDLLDCIDVTLHRLRGGRDV